MDKQQPCGLSKACDTSSTFDDDVWPSRISPRFGNRDIENRNRDGATSALKSQPIPYSTSWACLTSRLRRILLNRIIDVPLKQPGRRATQLVLLSDETSLS
jgi:hypothetical protein